MPITIVHKSIINLDADAIVNAANESLLEGGGVCGAIFKAAGEQELAEACAAYGHCDTGRAVITPGFRSRADYIIHAVGPVWQGGNQGEPRKLYQAYKRSLELAVVNGCSSIAFPLISSGIYGYPKEKAWEQGLTACLDYLKQNPGHDLQIIFAVTSDADWTLGTRILKNLMEGPNSGKLLADSGEEGRREAKRVLCFGDSLTWGYDPASRQRFSPANRWTGVLQSRLGAGWVVIEEGQNGRTIAVDDPAEGEKNGLTYLLPCLESQSPLDAMIVMLGSNDCKQKFGYSPMDIAGEMQTFLEKVQSYNRFRLQDTMKVILVSPPLLGEGLKSSWLGESFGPEARRVSQGLAGWYKKLAELYGCRFVDASLLVEASPVDAVHLDAANQCKLGRALANEMERLFPPEK